MGGVGDKVAVLIVDDLSVATAVVTAEVVSEDGCVENAEGVSEVSAVDVDNMSDVTVSEVLLENSAEKVEPMLRVLVEASRVTLELAVEVKVALRLGVGKVDIILNPEVVDSAEVTLEVSGTDVVGGVVRLSDTNVSEVEVAFRVSEVYVMVEFGVSVLPEVAINDTKLSVAPMVVVFPREVIVVE